MSGYGDRRRYGDEYDRGRRSSRDHSASRHSDRRRSISPDREPRNHSYRGRDDDRIRGSNREEQVPKILGKADVPSKGRLLKIQVAPMQGTSGEKTAVWVNHYEIQSLPIVKIYEYNITLKVPESSQRRGKEIVTSMQIARVILNQTFMKFVGPRFVFDGISLGWSPDAIVPDNETYSTRIDLPGHTNSKPNQIDIRIKNNGTLKIGEFVQYISKQDIELNPMGNDRILPLLKWLNAVYPKNPAANFSTRPNSNAYFERSPSTTMVLPSTAGVLEAIRGIFQTVQLRFGRITINVDTATSAFFVPNMCLIDLVHALTGIKGVEDLQKRYSRSNVEFRDACARLVGISFYIKHLQDPTRKERKIRLNSLSLKNAIDTVFETQDSSGLVSKTNVQQYFLRKYKKELKYPKLPLASTKDGEFPLELCFSAPGEYFKDALQGAETADFIKFATAPAYVRAQQIKANLSKLHWHDLEDCKAHGLSVNPNMMEVPARILASPIPEYGCGTTERRVPEKGAWNLRGKKLFQPKAVQSWGLLYFPGRNMLDDPAIENFLRNAHQGFGELGLSLNRPNGKIPWLKGNAQGAIGMIVGALMNKVQYAFGKKPQLLLFLIHSGHDPLYRAIKHVCDCQFGVASQVMLTEKATSRERQHQYLANVGLKINAKLGGINSKIGVELLKKKRYMLMGGDVSHPSPLQLRQNPPPPSYSALVASYDSDCTSYTAVVSAQFAKEQLISDFPAMAEELLSRYREKNDQMPGSVIYYRDGVSESEQPLILGTEGEPLREICKKHNIRATVLICLKRHHTRMFPTAASQGDRLGNVKPGTVVENSPNNDFFLVSHASLQGTARPTRYAVLFDDNNLSADELQTLTNAMSWNYARATRAVSIVSPVYYADQACARAKLQMRSGPDGTQVLGQVHDDLKFTMYWQ